MLPYHLHYATSFLLLLERTEDTVVHPERLAWTTIIHRSSSFRQLMIPAPSIALSQGTLLLGLGDSLDLIHERQLRSHSYLRLKEQEREEKCIHSNHYTSVLYEVARVFSRSR